MKTGRKTNLRGVYMKELVYRDNNKGFSLVELIVIMAIMAMSIGAVSLSVSLVTGSEAKKAFEKIEAQLDEVKTGSMSRFDETLEIKFLTADADYDESDLSGYNQSKDGFYAVKEMKTLSANATAEPGHYTPTDVSLGTEQVYLADKRVEMSIEVKDPVSGAIVEHAISGESAGVKFSFERATGLYGSVTGTDDEGNAFTGEPVSLSAKSGMKTYKMKFIKETGRHIRE